MGPGPPAHRPGRLAGAGALDRRHARPDARAVGASRQGRRLDTRNPRCAGAEAAAGGRAPRRARGWARRTRAPRPASGRPGANRAGHSGRSRPRPYQGDPPDAQAAPLPVPARSRRAVPRERAAAPRRRHGPREDRAGDCRVPCALALGPRPPGAARRPRRAQAPVASRVAALHRRARRGDRRQPRPAPRGVRGVPPRVPRGQLRTAPPRPGASSAAGPRTSSCSTRPSASRTGRPRRPSA